MVGRSRTGCLTCRQRKLKCDEQKPSCGQCQKAARQCIPSSGIVFRHQQNASMNSANPEDGDSLQGFYAYKNTFDKDSVWVNIPKRITFIVNADPYADLDGEDPASFAAHQAASPLEPFQSPGWTSAETTHDQSTRPHGLEALSAAASADHYGHLTSTQEPQANMHMARSSSDRASEVLRAMTSPATRSDSIGNSPHNNLNYILNPASALSPGADPGLDINLTRHQMVGQELEVETMHEVAFLLRHFSEVPGQWMDLFDLQSYFAYYVPVKAMTNPLLKNAACAYSAKQLSRVRGKRPIMGGSASHLAPSEITPDLTSQDWAYKGAQYYDKAISLLMEALKDGGVGARGGTPEMQQRPGSNNVESPNMSVTEKRRTMHNSTPSESSISSFDRAKRRKVSYGRSLSDEMTAATAILCVYELQEGSGIEWMRHLDGTKSLLDIVEGSMVSLQMPVSIPRPPISRARQATFWNFARQDALSALINETQTRLDTEDLPMWKDAGLLFDEEGFIRPSNISANGLPEGNSMKEDMISNALVWLIAKIVNYAVAADTGPNAANRESWEGINQATLYQTWLELQRHLTVWSAGLPDTFKPCAELGPGEISMRFPDGRGRSVFPEVWYNIPMVASTMQSYHMARMLLLLNQPQQSTIGKTTFHKRFGSYKSITADIEHHGRAICSIAVARPEGSVRIHSVQPLYTAGQCLEDPAERREIIRLLREIQDDTGWASEYRVKQLLEIWGWPDHPRPEP